VLIGLDDVDWRLLRHRGMLEELALQPLGALEHRERLAPHPVGNIAGSHRAYVAAAAAVIKAVARNAPNSTV
jgi:hypothetical protein